MLRVFFNSNPDAQVGSLHLTLYKVAFSRAVPFELGASKIEIALCFLMLGA